ncbi:hypothetical protein HaLaN_10073 [Haematococcus lacustris]|uniref:Uncharacterized protein n=1 Tax=Haematococcus lacustris TaxID=44745 RepID=A0A699Z4W1_HAELA|nr:hypothetical protein HaLaN_10073 [Haematococcus lacustris]
MGSCACSGGPAIHRSCAYTFAVKTCGLIATGLSTLATRQLMNNSEGPFERAHGYELLPFNCPTNLGNGVLLRSVAHPITTTARDKLRCHPWHSSPVSGQQRSLLSVHLSAESTQDKSTLQCCDESDNDLDDEDDDEQEQLIPPVYGSITSSCGSEDAWHQSPKPAPSSPLAIPTNTLWLKDPQQISEMKLLHYERVHRRSAEERRLAEQQKQQCQATAAARRQARPR